MEILWALIFGLNIYEYMKKDDVQPTKHQVVDVRINNIDMKYSKSIEKNVNGGYYSNGVLQDSEIKWVIKDFSNNE